MWRNVESAFASRNRTGMVVNLLHIDLKAFLLEAKELIIEQINNSLQTGGSIKANVILTCKFRKTAAEEQVGEMKTIATKNEVVLSSSNISDWVDEFINDRLQVNVEDFEHRDSGWSLLEILNITLNMNKFVLLVGGNGSTYTTLLKSIRNKKAVVNTHNNDNFCFL